MINSSLMYGYLENPNNRVAVTQDNIYDRNPVGNRMRGDYAVPTLFNGNFDAVAVKMDDQAIPGWSDTLQNQLVDVNTIPSLNNHLTKLGSNRAIPNYAVELTSGESITHNRFVVPDWGALRFDVHVPNPNGGKLRVSLNVDGQDYKLGEPDPNTVAQVGWATVSLYEFDKAGGVDEQGNPYLGGEVFDVASAVAQRNRIGFGTQGFETFQLDIPENLRGKVATLKFEVEGNTTVYLDDIFFKSKHLSMGNPTLEGQEARANTVTQPNNYLFEKPQYSMSYNNSTKIPNWVSWQLNNSWIGSLTRRNEPPYFVEDNLLPLSNKVVDNDYNGSAFTRGHLAPASDRTRHMKDLYSTFTLSNIVPQGENYNSGPWALFEQYLDQLTQQGKEIYLIAGGYERLTDNPLWKDLLKNDPLVQANIEIPSHLWKVALVLNKPGLNADSLSDRDGGGIVDLIAIEMPNDPTEPITNPQKWDQWKVSVDYIESKTKLDLLSNLPDEVENRIEQNKEFVSVTTASLLADWAFDSKPLYPPVSLDTTVRHDGVLKNGTLSGAFETNLEITNFSKISLGEISKLDYGIEHLSPRQDGFSQVSSEQVGSSQVSFKQISVSQVGFEQVGLGQVGSVQNSMGQISPSQISIAQVGVVQSNSLQSAPSQINSTQISVGQGGTIQIGTNQVSSSQVDATKISLLQFGLSQTGSSKLSLPSSIALQQFLSSHNFSLQNTTIPAWTSFLQGQTPFNLNLEIKDLPIGQLAEASLTSYDRSGRPNSGILTLDHDANGLGWFIDSTPLDNSEFNLSLTDSAFKATPSSPAFGRYDLLTTVLHELGHLNGIISGNPTFDAHVQTVNGSPFFIGDGFTAHLTPDGSHLDSRYYPYDLMNTRLAPGVRKLPSALDLQILQTLWQGQAGQIGQAEVLQAPLRSTPLVGITNGDFSLPAAPDWDTRGSAQLLNAQALLSEQSPLLSNLSQTFLIPDGAKALQFEILNAELDPSRLAPGDAFEVALLDAHTLTSLVDTAAGLTHTDSFLNLQHTGQHFAGAGVTVSATANGTRLVTLDLSGVQANTLATLSFDLLGFGTRDGSVILDNVKLLTQFAPPTATADTATTTQAQAVSINILANDSDSDGVINPATVQIASAPTGGSVSVNADGTLLYTPNAGFVGTDTLTYTVQDNRGLQSSEATVTIVTHNSAPTITSLTRTSSTVEGQAASFSATATDPGNDPLSYTWNFGDGTPSVSSAAPSVAHTFADNGTYTATLTVTDTHGATTTETHTIVVTNAAPTVNAGVDPTINEGQSFSFNAAYADPGVLDTHTITWNFGDGTTAEGTLTPTHTYADNGTYTATLTVTDKDGAITVNTVTVAVNNVAPTITESVIPTAVAQGSTASFSATATDPGVKCQAF